MAPTGSKHTCSTEEWDVWITAMHASRALFSTRAHIVMGADGDDALLPWGGRAEEDAFFFLRAGRIFCNSVRKRERVRVR